MEMQRRYGYVAIGSPFVEEGGLAVPIDEFSHLTQGLPQGDPRYLLTKSGRSQIHIHFLMVVVLLVSAFGFWVVIRPRVAVSASGQQPFPADDGFSLFNDSATLAKNDASAITESDMSDNTEGFDQQTLELGNLSSLFTPEVRYWEPQIVRWAAEYDVDPNIVATIMQIESCGNPQASSYAGAQGLFQVMPFHFLPGENMLDPDTNAMRGLAFYQEQMRYTAGDVFLSFAGYNGGYAASGGAYENWAEETQRYYYWARGIYLDASSGADESSRLAEWLAAGGGGGCQIAAAVLGI